MGLETLPLSEKIMRRPQRLPDDWRATAQDKAQESSYPGCRRPKVQLPILHKLGTVAPACDLGGRGRRIRILRLSSAIE